MMLAILGRSSRIMVLEHANHAKENEFFDAKPHVDAIQDQLVQMVMELSLQNECSKSQFEGLRVVLSESDGFSLFRFKVPQKRNWRDPFAGDNMLVQCT